MRRYILAALCAGAATFAVAGLATPTFAQTIEEVTVTARLPSGEPSELSEIVNIRDLDLTTRAGESAMHARVRQVADRLCARLGETGGGQPLSTTVRSCQEDAFLRTRGQMEVAVSRARSGTAFASASPAPLPPEPAPVPPPAPSASAAGAPASATFTSSTVTNGPVPDTAENRARYGQPLSNAGRRTAPRGN